MPKRRKYDDEGRSEGIRSKNSGDSDEHSGDGSVRTPVDDRSSPSSQSLKKNDHGMTSLASSTLHGETKRNRPSKPKSDALANSKDGDDVQKQRWSKKQHRASTSRSLAAVPMAGAADEATVRATSIGDDGGGTSAIGKKPPGDASQVSHKRQRPVASSQDEEDSTTPDMKKMTQKERRLHMSRINAQRNRDRKRVMLSMMQEDKATLTDANAKLRSDNALLRSIITQLKQSRQAQSSSIPAGISHLPSFPPSMVGVPPTSAQTQIRLPVPVVAGASNPVGPTTAGLFPRPGLAPHQSSSSIHNQLQALSAQAGRHPVAVHSNLPLPPSETKNSANVPPEALLAHLLQATQTTAAPMSLTSAVAGHNAVTGDRMLTGTRSVVDELASTQEGLNQLMSFVNRGGDANQLNNLIGSDGNTSSQQQNALLIRQQLELSQGIQRGRIGTTTASSSAQWPLSLHSHLGTAMQVRPSGQSIGVSPEEQLYRMLATAVAQSQIPGIQPQLQRTSATSGIGPSQSNAIAGQNLSQSSLIQQSLLSSQRGASVAQSHTPQPHLQILTGSLSSQGGASHMVQPSAQPSSNALFGAIPALDTSSQQVSTLDRLTLSSLLQRPQASGAVPSSVSSPGHSAIGSHGASSSGPANVDISGGNQRKSAPPKAESDEIK